MHQALTDFRIEDDNLVFLQFSNGKTYRVTPSDLPHHLTKSDLARVRKAITLRSSFIKKVLPPTAILLLVISVAGVGAYDMQQLADRTSSPVVVPATAPLETQSTTAITSADSATSSQSEVEAATPQPSATPSSAMVMMAAAPVNAAPSAPAVQPTMPASQVITTTPATLHSAVSGLTQPIDGTLNTTVNSLGKLLAH